MKPRLVIEIALEERPTIRHDTLSDADDHRLELWVKSNPKRLALVRDALLLRTGPAA